MIDGHNSEARVPGGISDESGLPTNWSTTENVAWVTDVPGFGWSSPIVWDDTVFLTTVVSSEPVEEPLGGFYRGRETWLPSQVEHRWLVYAIDVETGSVKWEREVHRSVPEGAHHLKNTLATETAVTDGESVYAYFGNVGVYCLDADGTVRWSYEIEASDTRLSWGTAASPVLYRDHLYIVNDNDAQSYPVGAQQGNRWGGVADGPRRRYELVHSLHLGERGTDRDRHVRHRQSGGRAQETGISHQGDKEERIRHIEKEEEALIEENTGRRHQDNGQEIWYGQGETSKRPLPGSQDVISRRIVVQISNSPPTGLQPRWLTVPGEVGFLRKEVHVQGVASGCPVRPFVVQDVHVVDRRDGQPVQRHGRPGDSSLEVLLGKGVLDEDELARGLAVTQPVLPSRRRGATEPLAPVGVVAAHAGAEIVWVPLHTRRPRSEAAGSRRAGVPQPTASVGPGRAVDGSARARGIGSHLPSLPR